MKNLPYLSIIVPCYKRISQTIKTIKLIFNSKGFNSEFQAEVIVADSTPDNSLKDSLLKTFGSKIIYTKPKTPGIATNKNQGAKIAKNPILIFCDSDMEVEKDTLINTIKSLKKHDTAAGVGGQVIWKGGPKNGQFDRPRAEDRRIKVRQTIYIEAIYSRFFATYKDVFWEVGGYDEKIFNMRGEGSDLSIRYWRMGYPLAYDPSIRVHHIYDAPDSIALRIKEPDLDIAKDLLILAYKYDLLDPDNINFVKTVAANFKKFGDAGYFKIIQGITKHLDFITKVKAIIDTQKKNEKVKFNFKFLEVFSNKEMFEKCIIEAQDKLAKIRKKSFPDL